MTKTWLAALAFGAMTAVSGPVFADKLKATLNGKSEVPPTSSAGTGTAEFDYDPATRTIGWELTFAGLSGPPVSAHVQGPAVPGKTGTVVFELGPSMLSGKTVLNDVQAADLLAGKFYINIRTARFPGGEIRGQIMK